MRKFRAAKKPRLAGPRAGNAGLIATIAIAFAGVAVGAISAYMGERGARATARSAVETAQPGEADDSFLAARDRIVAQILADPAPERLTPPDGMLRAYESRSAIRPKIVVIIDDMGVDRRASENALKLPGPVTFSFLPYARGVADLASAAHASGGEIMLHLPMEPEGAEDPGPYALKGDMTGAQFMQALEWNLSRFDGYVGVNNHMGSKLTADMAAMKTLLGYLDHKGVFFLDSVTTSETTARRAARELGLDVFARDVFIDPETGSEQSVRTQLALAERIARETGYVIAIGHPRPETLSVLGPWMTTAPARGFDLVYASALKTIHDNAKPKTLAAAPTLRF